VRLIGDSVAIIAYNRLTQSGFSSSVAQETRVWEKRAGAWLLVHFHKSVQASL
jgi:hypothetical protein